MESDGLENSSSENGDFQASYKMSLQWTLPGLVHPALKTNQPSSCEMSKG